jgi:hypothetical protein
MGGVRNECAPYSLNAFLTISLFVVWTGILTVNTNVHTFHAIRLGQWQRSQMRQAWLDA